MRNTDPRQPGRAAGGAAWNLAACFRAAARFGLHEGRLQPPVVYVPGRDDLFLVNPDGWSFAENDRHRAC